MAEATKTPKTAQTPKDEADMIARLAARGEQTIARLAELPGGAKALRAVNDLRTRVDELAKVPAGSTSSRSGS